MKEIYLGGTCANNRWREDIVIPALVERGVPEDAIFNPNLGTEGWNEAAQETEDEVRGSCSLVVYYLGDTRDGTGVSFYSAMKAVMTLYDRPTDAFVVIDASGTEGHVAMALERAYRELKKRFPDANLADNLQDLITYVADRYGRRQRLGGRDI